MANEDRLLTETEAAKLARVSVNTLRHWRQTGKLPFTKPGRHPMIWQSVLDNLLKKPVNVGE